MKNAILNVNEFRQWFRDRNFEEIKAALHRKVSIESQEYIHHPLGFLLTEILREGETVLRLHYWKHELITLGSAVTPYHDHIWRLSSCVLFGEIENCVLDVRANPNGEYVLTEVEQSGGMDRVPSKGERVSFEISSRDRIRRGEFYSLPPRVFHYSRMVEGSNALTIVLSEPEILGSPRTLMPIGAPGHAPVRKKMSGNSEMDKELLSLLEN